MNENPDDEALAKAIFSCQSDQEAYDLMKDYLAHFPIEERIVALSKIVSQMTSVMRAVIRRGEELGVDVIGTARKVYDRERFDEIVKRIHE